jgi:hypothetical protein
VVTPVGGRFVIHLPAPEGDSEVEVRVRRDFVEFWHRNRCGGVFDRRMLQDWLAYPDGRLTVDDVSLIALRGNGIGLILDRVGSWALGGHALAGLRSGV